MIKKCEDDQLMKIIKTLPIFIISRRVDDIVSSIQKEEDMSYIAIVMGIYNYGSLLLKKIKADPNNSSRHKLMDEININQREFLTEWEDD